MTSQVVLAEAECLTEDEMGLSRSAAGRHSALRWLIVTLEGEDAHAARLETWHRFTDVPLLIVAIGTLPLLALEVARNELPSGDRSFLDAVNLAVLILFAVDYVVELILATDRRQQAKREWSSLVVVVAQGAALISGLPGLGALRAVRALRLVMGVGRLLALGGVASRQGKEALRRHAALAALATAGLTWISSAVAFTLVEDVGQGKSNESFFDALWWSTTTITTVGYGDVYPVTPAGRLVAAVTLVVGVSSFGVVTAKLAAVLLRPEEDRLPDEVR